MFTQRGERGVIVKTLPTTALLEKLAEKLGLEIEKTPVGSKHFSSFTKIDDGKSLLVTAEESGNMFTKFIKREKTGEER